VVSALDKKLLRELVRLRAQAVSIASLVAVSVAVFVCLHGVMRSLERAATAHYQAQRFAHVFASVTRAPRALEARVREIPGVGEVEARVVTEARLLDLPGEPAIARLVSLPPSGASRLNRLVLRRGRIPSPERPEECLVSEAFADARRLGPGDTLAAVVDGRRFPLTVVGVVLSPEFVFALRPGEIAPDERRFAVVWTSEERLARALDMDGAFDDLAVALAPGASERVVVARLDALLAPYGGAGAHGRGEHISHVSLTNKLTQLIALSRVVPAVFLAVAAFLLQVVLGRVVGSQRAIIATLKAFGYGDAAVAAHYLALSLVIALAGVVVGVAAGAALGGAMLSFYYRYFRLPGLAFQLDLGAVAVASLSSLGAAAAGALEAVRRAVAETPASAMRPEAPARYRPTLLERLVPRGALSTRMVLRQLGRRPLRAALGALGVAFAVAIVVAANFLGDSISRLIYVQFRAIAREDATVIFDRPLGGAAVHALAQLPGVLRVEPVRMSPARFVAGARARRLALAGVLPDAALHRVLDAELRPVAIPPGGVVLNRALAEALALRPGDHVTVALLEGSRATRELLVSGISDELLGISATMDLDALHALLGEGASVSAAYLALDERAAPAVVARLEALPGVSSVALRRPLLALFEAEIRGRMRAVSVLLGLFAALIAVGVVYNGASVSFAEREHELGCLRVLGFTRGEVSALLLGELGVEVAAAIPLGLSLGWALTRVMARGLASELYRFPAVIEPSTYALAVVVVLAAAIASGLVVRRRVDRIDLAEVLRTRE
jgi:putative ABC transport system permease protein